MAREVDAHLTSLTMIKPAPGRLNAGSDLALRIGVSCASKCDLKGCKVRIVAKDGAVLAEAPLATFDGAASETDGFIVKAPVGPGEYTWTAIFPSQEMNGQWHRESSVPISFAVPPHWTSMAVWDVPSPVVIGSRFQIRVGLRCSAACAMAGEKVEILDQDAHTVGEGRLGERRWSEEGAMYWAELELLAPLTEGIFQWQARFPEPVPGSIHEGSHFFFSFGTARQPDHSVSFEVVHGESGKPVESADVILHPYRTRTDAAGKALLQVPKGDYELFVSAFAMETFRKTLPVGADLAIKADLALAPVEDTRG